MIEIETKKFEELSTDELYSILQLRSAIFVVEQDCVYQDLDGKDAMAIHVLGKKEGELVAYTRIFAPGAYFKEASIGRVAVKKRERQFGYGRVIMLASIKAVQDYFQESKIHLSAQAYLTKFYQSLGFVVQGETYLEDDIPHIAMVKTK